MSSVVLKNIEKVYPAIDEKKHKKKHHQPKDEPAANLKVTEEGVLAVQDFNIDIQDKEFVVLVGPSGCGKSTTLRMIAGLEDITHGDLYIDGKRMNDIAPKDRDIAMVFQNYALYPHMKVYDNIAFSLQLRKVPKDVIDKKVHEVAKILGIEEYLGRKPKNLSGGQRQRVAIGRAIIRNPKVLLMDEPLSNLDAKLRNQMRAEIIKLRERINTTFIYVTHDQVEAMTLGDRIVVMKDGMINQIGTPSDVFSHPVNTFVAGFIGNPTINFFPNSKIELENDEYYYIIGGYKYRVPSAYQNKLKEEGVEEKEVICAVRPDYISISEKGIPAVVDVSEIMGTHIHIHLKMDDMDDIISVVPANEVMLDLSHGLHHKVYFTFNPNNVLAFDKDTKKNVFYN